MIPAMTQRNERRKAPRIAYFAHAFVHCQNRRHTCQILNLSRKGALLTPPINAKPGTFIRLNLKLPQVEELIDLDAVVIRTTKLHATYAWGVSFLEVPERADALLKTFVNWVIATNSERKKKNDKPVTRETPKPERMAESKDDLEGWVDNSDLQRGYGDALRGITSARKTKG